MNNRLQTIWNIAEKHGEAAALFALELQSPVSAIASEFGLAVASKAAECIAAHKWQEDAQAKADQAEQELNEVAQGLSEERSDRLLSLMFPV